MAVAAGIREKVLADPGFNTQTSLKTGDFIDLQGARTAEVYVDASGAPVAVLDGSMNGLDVHANAFQTPAVNSLVTLSTLWPFVRARLTNMGGDGVVNHIYWHDRR